MIHNEIYHMVPYLKEEFSFPKTLLVRRKRIGVLMCVISGETSINYDH